MAKRPPKKDTTIDAGNAAMTVPRRGPAEPKPTKVASTKEQTIAKLWGDRLRRANKTFDTWSDKYECNHLDDYYRGQHWRGVADNEAKRKYVINMVFATVESQLPSLLFSKPKVMVEARPDHEGSAGSQASGRATLIEQTLQTYIDDPKVSFSYETNLALRDAYARYAIVEVGYSADWIDNPNADKPVLKDDNSVMLDDKQEPVMQPKKKLNGKESLFVRRLPPQCYRVSPGRNRLLDNDWVAYYEWVLVEDVKRNKEYENTDSLKSSGTLVTPTEAELTDERDDAKKHLGMVKLWKIFDLRSNVRHVYVDGHDSLLQENKPWPVLQHAVLKFYELPDAFLPLPPIYNWLGPQDEINETREMAKIHRRRAVRRYMHLAQVDATELEKLETGEDMTAIKVSSLTPPPIVPIQDAPLDRGNIEAELAASENDLNQVTGVTGETRNNPTAPTATQANIVNTRAQIRESRARVQVADWLAEIARLMLVTLRRDMSEPFMVRRSVDPFAADQQQTQTNDALWKQVKSEDLSDLDVDVKIDVTSLSPVAEEAQRNQWNVVLQLLTNPALATLLMTPNPQAPNDPSPLLRKTLMLNGITSDQEIREIWRVGQAIIQNTMQAQQQAQQQQKFEPIKISLALKGEDLSNPANGPLIVWLLKREEGLDPGPMPTGPPLVPGGPSAPSLGKSNGQGGMAVPAPAGRPTGIPAVAPGAGQ